MSSAPTLAPALPAGQSAEDLKVKLRPDLVVQPQFYEGMTHYVIKDPIGLKYFRFKIEEYFLLQQFDGKNTLQDVKRAFERKYRPQTISVDDLIRFASQLHEAGIAQVDTPEQGKVLIQRRRKNKWKRVWQFMANILYIKIPIIDPERMLTGMYPYFRWLYTKFFIVTSVGTMLAALTLVVTQWAQFYSKLPEFQSFFNWYTIVYFWCSLAVVKVIHEFGHGLTAKHFGGEVHEMGMLFLVLTPALYCDVTDCWLLPSKWKRIWISAAGIYVELFLASIATFVWFNTQPGILNSLMLSTMFICSVNTVLFNANPLLRYDGYYVMSDYLEIPNLRIKSTQFFIYLFQEKILGLEIPVQSYMPRSRRSLFVIYAIASYLYRWVVTFSILFFLNQFLRPYKLTSISRMLALASLIPLLVVPMFSMVKFVNQPGRMRKVKKARAAGFFAVVAAIVTLVLLIPTPMRVAGTLVLTVADPAIIYPEVEGQVTEILVHDGDPVAAGQPIAKLLNLTKSREREALTEQVTINLAKAKMYNQPRSGSVTAISDRGIAQGYQDTADKLEPAVTKVNEQIAKLTLYAPRDGFVIGLPHKETTGQWLKPGGKPFCEVGDLRRLEAHLILDQSDVDFVKLNQASRPKAWIKIGGDAEHTLRSHVSQVAKKNRDEIPPELATQGGGEIATKPDQKTGTAKPLSAVYEVIIPVNNDDGTLQPGLRGYAKIDAGHCTLGWWLWRAVTKTFHFTI